MSSASMSALFTKEPSRVKMSSLIALYGTLECTPNDLFEVNTTPSQGTRQAGLGADRCARL
nr:helix-turn-helix transcriptional regulator [Streptomyces scabiei]